MVIEAPFEEERNFTMLALQSLKVIAINSLDPLA